MIDAELDMLQKRLDTPPFGTETSERLLFGAAFEAITYLRATLKSVLQREAEAYVRHDAKADALETQLAERDALGAVVMRERAAARMDEQALTDEELRQGYEFTVNYPRIAAEAIRAIPTPTHAELLAHALTLPEIKTLVNLADELASKDTLACDGGELDWFITDAREALAALAQMEGKE